MRREASPVFLLILITDVLGVTVAWLETPGGSGAGILRSLQQQAGAPTEGILDSSEPASMARRSLTDLPGYTSQVDTTWDHSVATAASMVLDGCATSTLVSSPQACADLCTQDSRCGLYTYAYSAQAWGACPNGSAEGACGACANGLGVDVCWLHVPGTPMGQLFTAPGFTSGHSELVCPQYLGFTFFSQEERSDDSELISCVHANYVTVDLASQAGLCWADATCQAFTISGQRSCLRTVGSPRYHDAHIGYYREFQLCTGMYVRNVNPGVPPPSYLKPPAPPSSPPSFPGVSGIASPPSLVNSLPAQNLPGYDRGRTDWNYNSRVLSSGNASCSSSLASCKACCDGSAQCGVFMFGLGSASGAEGCWILAAVAGGNSSLAAGGMTSPGMTSYVKLLAAGASAISETSAERTPASSTPSRTRIIAAVVGAVAAGAAAAAAVLAFVVMRTRRISRATAKDRVQWSSSSVAAAHSKDLASDAALVLRPSQSDCSKLIRSASTQPLVGLCLEGGGRASPPFLSSTEEPTRAAIKLPLCESSVRLDLDCERDIVIHWALVLGSGASGVVHQGVYQNYPVAVKRLMPSLCGEALKPLKGNACEPDDFHRELRLMASLRHKNVVALRGACVQPPQVLLVLELMAVSLDAYLHSAHTQLAPALPMLSVFKIAADILSGLVYLHSLDTLHGDLKPTNILLTAGGTAKISDFGLARRKFQVYPSTGETGAGTIAYMSPECFDDSLGSITAKADVYSFGIILWEMVSLNKSWVGLNRPNIIYRVLVQNTRPPVCVDKERCPRKMGLLIEACWARSACDRPSAAAALKELMAIEREHAA